ncbi:MAG: hypothetical protein OEW62_06870 [Candidatus Bathyarchaeota archaeon]|nr:hypothetical protein [Candidatus Bathyarchaeota archaeon]
MTAAPEGAAPPKQLIFSPLKRFQRTHCQQCNGNCNPTEQRMLICLLAALLDTINRNNQLNTYRGAHI